MQSITIAAALLAAIPAAVATGKATVVNNCDSSVHLWTADTERGQLGPHSLSSGGGSWSESYYMVGSGDSSDGGVSIKLTTGDECEGAITQFEYTLSADGSPDLWYDISNVNCKGDSCPFYDGGFYLSAPTVVDCGPLTLLCDAVYNLFNDDKATHGTESSEDLVLYLCGKDGDSSSVEVSTSWESSTVAVSHAYSTVSTPSYTPATSTPVVTSSTPAYTPSTLVTATPSSAAPVEAAEVAVSSEADGEVVTEIVTEYATAVVTAWAHAARSAAPHAHARRHEHHHAGHPHYRK